MARRRGRAGGVSYLDRIAECNVHDPANFVPFTVAGTRVGSIKHAFARRLRDFSDAFAVSDAGVAMADGLDDHASRTDAADAAIRRLAEAGDIPGWRDEPYPVGGTLAGPHLMTMERAAVPLFGVRAYGVHVNGYVTRDGAPHMWIARRAADKETFPGMLDNMIAGGQPVGIGLKENVIKEAGEEANVPRELAERAYPVGIVTYRQETETGFKPDVMYAYDMEIPADFEPVNTDGEIDEFALWPIDKVMETVSETREFKPNCNLIVIDFLVRRGLIEPERADYIEIVEGLRR
jgi:isopentenyldiphosphate isomerase